MFPDRSGGAYSGAQSRARRIMNTLTTCSLTTRKVFACIGSVFLIDNLDSVLDEMKIDGLTRRDVSARNDALKYRTCTWRLSSTRIYSGAKIKAALANPQGFRRNVTHSAFSFAPRAVKPTCGEVQRSTLLS